MGREVIARGGGTNSGGNERGWSDDWVETVG